MTSAIAAGAGDGAGAGSSGAGAWLRRAIIQHEGMFRDQVRELHRLYWTQKNLMREVCRSSSAGYRRSPVTPAPMMTSPSAAAPAEYRGQLAPMMSSSLTAAANYRGQVMTSPTAAVREEYRSFPGKAEYLGINGFRPLAECSGKLAPVMTSQMAAFECQGQMRPAAATREDLGLSLELGLPMVAETGVGVAAGSEMPRSDLSSLNGGPRDPSISLCSQKKIPNPAHKLHIDLNMDQDSGSFNHSNHSTITFASPTTSSSVQHAFSTSASVQQMFLWREPTTTCSKERITSQPEYINPHSVTSGENVAGWLFHASQVLQTSNTQASASNNALENNWKHEPEAMRKIHQSAFNTPERSYRTTGEHYSVSDGVVQTTSKEIIPSSKGSYKSGEENADSNAKRQASAVTFSSGFDYSNQHTSVGSTNPMVTVITNSDGRQTNYDRSEEDTLSSHTMPQDKNQEDELLEEFPIGKKITEANGNNDSSAVCTSVEQHGILPDGEDSQTKQTLVKRYPSKYAPETCDHVRLHDDFLCDEILEPLDHLDQVKDIDSMVNAAAETLVSFTLNKTASPLNIPADIEQTESEDNQPQYSSDSYESITLKLTESRDDRFSMPYTSTEEVRENDACGVKARRGRRQLDFQKDVMPGLVSLSRHEIRQDLQSIGYELKWNRSRRQPDNSSVPVRRRRSTRKSAGRRP